jgi:Rrf2 family protein
MLSKTAGYAIQLLVYLAQKSKDKKDRSEELFFVKDIAKEIGVPQNFLSKIAVTLSKKGVIGAQKGPKGGIFLKLSPNRITLYDICEMFDESIVKDNCIIGRPTCPSQDCPVHDFWVSEKEKLIRYLKSTTLAKLVVESKGEEKA